MFKFTPEMGLRLRELRLREGMTQQELAVLMGRQGKGNHQLIGKVELGKAPYPSLGFVADYLRACKASFDDIADLLNAYTAQPTVIEQRGYERVRSLAARLSRQAGKAVVRYDLKVTTARGKPESMDERLRHARAYAEAAEKLQQLNRLIEDEIAKAGLGPFYADAIRLREYARKLWGLLTCGKDEHKLKPKLEKLERWTAEVGIVSLPVLATLRERVAALVDEQWKIHDRDTRARKGQS